MQVITHSGGFHADDAVAWALVRAFVPGPHDIERSRDPARIEAADLVFDVGGRYDPDARRFDHHQPDYQGPLSSAGMVLRWLADEGLISATLRDALARELVDYVDAVDNGRRSPERDVPCIANVVDALNNGCTTPGELASAFARASDVALAMVDGIRAGHDELRLTRELVRTAMADAKATGSNLVVLDRYLRWKPAYFENGGESHPTEFVVFPSSEGDWRVVAIPPLASSFDQKCPLPDAWAGLRDAELSAVTGVSGSIFCHKNRFIAVFETREGALQALANADLVADGTGD